MLFSYCGFNGFNQWPSFLPIIENFQFVDLQYYLESDDKILNFDWSLEWAYSVLVINSQISINGFCRSPLRSEIIHHPNGLKFTGQSCNDKYILFFNQCDKTVWMYDIDPDAEQVWKRLPNFIDAEKDIDTMEVDNVEMHEEFISKIACGIKINIALTTKGRLFNIPTEIPLDDILGKIIDICCGHEHAMLLTDQGNVYTWGGGSRCQLGHGNTDSLERPHLVEGLAGIQIVKISAAGWHCCAISSFGDLYTWGWNDQGQLGIDSPESNKMQEKPNESEEIAKPSTSSFKDDLNYFSTNSDFAVKFTRGDDYSDDEFNYCDEKTDTQDKSCSVEKRCHKIDATKNKSSEENGTFNSVAIPNLIDFYDSLNKKILEFNVVDVSCGSKHTVVKLDDGTIWGSGSNKYGQLGYQTKLYEKIGYFIKMNVENAHNSMLKCGAWSTTFVTLD